jgi:hypothetical protein
MCLVPGAALIDLANDIEEVALLERELLRGGGTVATACTYDLLRRGDSG